jgi:hypothetical protein
MFLQRTCPPRVSMSPVPLHCAGVHVSRDHVPMRPLARPPHPLSGSLSPLTVTQRLSEPRQHLLVWNNFGEMEIYWWKVIIRY